MKLTTGAFAADPGIGRTEAPRRSMWALYAAGGPENAHPSYWGPFVLVGRDAR